MAAAVAHAKTVNFGMAVVTEVYMNSVDCAGSYSGRVRQGIMLYRDFPILYMLQSNR